MKAPCATAQFAANNGGSTFCGTSDARQDLMIRDDHDSTLIDWTADDQGLFRPAETTRVTFLKERLNEAAVAADASRARHLSLSRSA